MCLNKTYFDCSSTCLMLTNRRKHEMVTKFNRESVIRTCYTRLTPVVQRFDMVTQLDGKSSLRKKV